MPPVKIVGLGGSLAPASSSLTALKIALDAARDAGAETELIHLPDLDLPLFVPNANPSPPGAVRLSEAFYQADGLLWSSPLYHGTVSGAFKNALDWLELLGKREPAYLTDKVIGLIATAGGTQSLQAINTLEYVARALRGWAVPLSVPVNQAYKVFDKDGTILDAKIGDALRALGGEVVRAADRFRTILPLTTLEAQQAEADEQPLSPQEVKQTQGR